jgi:primosomal protein N' (replication factor Y)
MKYADIILPLPLEGYFTYSVPSSMNGIRTGMRVLCPLGKTKRYIGIVAALHDNKPDFEVKAIESLLDTIPSVPDKQLRLWKWIADYYLCPIGDVYKAALPSGMKAEEGYRPKTETYLEISPDFIGEKASFLIAGLLSRSRRQQEVFEAFQSLSKSNGSKGVTREELMNQTNCTSAVLKGLVDKGILRTVKKKVGRLNVCGEPHPELLKQLSEAQEDAYNSILMQMMKKNVVLLHGVTSSGKTEIYIHLIEKTLKEHKQVLYLLPEIALTVQITERLQRIFGSRLGIYHSKYSDTERVEIWQKQLSDHPYDVILGARSAVFLPFSNLGLVIVDEEHETSFKQQDPAPRYHARSVAIVLAQMYGAKTLLGTATPSMESWNNAQTGKYGYVRLSHRYKDVELPKIEVVNIKDLRHRKMMKGPFSPRLLSAVREALRNGQQAILFQNRRGFAPMIECPDCGWVPKCVNCDVSLTYHKRLNMLTCHYCGAVYRVPDKCPNCGCRDIRSKGFGTEKIEDYIREIFPEARISRMDLDTTRTRNAYERIIKDFSTGATNILIGTQMVTKGLDFDKVSVVGILDADTMLNYPDFRAYEHAFNMISQVSGRAGRRGRRGLVILQTKNPDLPVIREVVEGDYNTFYKQLATERRAFHYPPYYHLINIYVKHREETFAEHAAQELGNRLTALFGNRVLGPDKPSIARVKLQYIRKLVLKLENGIDQRRVREVLRRVLKEMMNDRKFGALQVYYDVDPE